MSHSTLSSQEVARRGKELYERSIRAKVETQENIGKIISINGQLPTTNGSTRMVEACVYAPPQS